MIEQFIYDKITNDPTLQTLLHKGSDDFYIYPNVIPRGEDSFDVAITFTLVITRDVYPASRSVNVQFNIFSASHGKTAETAKALFDLFNDFRYEPGAGEDDTVVIYSQRSSESDLGKPLDNEGLYQREATYYFKLK